MSLDNKIKNAIELSVQEAGQPATLASRLIAWFEAINDGNEDVNDAAQVQRHLESLYDGTDLKESDTDEFTSFA